MLKEEKPHLRVRAALPKSLIILAAHDEMQRSADTAYTFTQEPSFRWVTGIVEPGWRAVLTPDEFILVAPHRDETKQLFEGALSTEDALATSGATRVIDEKQAEALLVTLAKQYDAVYTLGDDPHAEHYTFTMNPAPSRLRTELANRFGEVKDARPVFAKLRSNKTEAEVAAMQAAVDISVRAFEDAKEGLSSAKHEYELEAVLSHGFRAAGADGHAYDPIVAAGLNACTLHYVQNNAPLADGTLVLIDAGAALQGYAADITRTWAIGTPTSRHIEVHAAVETAHRRIIELIKPGVSFKDYQDAVDEIMKDALVGLGLLQDRDDTITYRNYFPHAVSHGIGLDVHESLGGVAAFAPGMTLTVEPGIYIPEEAIGVRIEDDILVTEGGNKNLSGHLPTSL